MNNKYQVSFVIPVYKSENTIKNVILEIDKVKEFDWEVVLVNDNSPDNVDKVIKELIKNYPKRITYIRFRKNCGQHSAIIEGLRYATKEFVTTIDDDGQNPPTEIKNMIRVMIDCDYDVVYGVLKDKKHSFARNIVSRFNRLISVITINNKNKIPISNVRLMRNEIANSIANTGGYSNYIEGLIFSLTDHVGFIHIEHKERTNGRSSYNFLKLIKLWSNHVIGYSNVLIKSISLLSFCIAIFAFIVGLFYFLLTINETGRPSGWLSTYLTITFLFSIIFLVLGILTEYVGRIYIRVNQNSKQIINKVYIHDKSN